jgi:hypothetical protein
LLERESIKRGFKVSGMPCPRKVSVLLGEAAVILFQAEYV